ncbi:MAG: hypothetical protein DRG78_00540 [Epsilonproteobacteria bacterium]|nr:MAG: hypothetical protein DRG78_00540 [Campylobacterota bacterium]
MTTEKERIVNSVFNLIVNENTNTQLQYNYITINKNSSFFSCSINISKRWSDRNLSELLEGLRFNTITLNRVPIQRLQQFLNHYKLKHE